MKKITMITDILDISHLTCTADKSLDHWTDLDPQK
jgi:hypothetical protein